MFVVLYNAMSLPLYRYTLAFVFVPLVESDMKEFVFDWNNHPIRHSAHSTIGGVPVDLYDMPQQNGKYIP